MTISLEVFDPPMCCPTGLCGPQVDPALVRFQETLRKVQEEYDGRVKVARHGLPHDAEHFARNPLVFKMLEDFGVDVLPLTLLAGRPIKQGEYLAGEDLREAIEGALVSGNGGV